MKFARAALILLAAGGAFGSPRAPAPADLPRMEICLNGDWETVFNAPAGTIPQTGWQRRRVPAMPLVTNPPTVSVWYRLPIEVPREWIKSERRFLVRVEKAGHYAAIYWNGRLMGEHYGQFTAFEADVTKAVKLGVVNQLAIYVHNATLDFVRAGLMFDDDRIGNAYRGATDQQWQRNWVGIVGDIYLCWRPNAYVADVAVEPSVRKHRLEARVRAAGGGLGVEGLTARADVLDGSKVVKKLGQKTLGDDGLATLATDWKDPVLWGPAPYGTPKLYTLRTELTRDGRLVDRVFTRFGFREAWVAGRDVLLNGKKLWMAGTYFGKLAPVRYLNDLHPQVAMIELMQASGLNTLHGHWDELGGTWLDRCDEMGMLVLGGFYCDGRPQIQSVADAGWADWTTSACGQWVRENRNHPSIVMWRPVDLIPQNVSADRPALYQKLDEVLRKEDGTRPVADDSDVDAWAQSPLKDPRNKTDYDDGTRMAEKLASSSKPLLTKEIYTGFADFGNLSQFFRAFYEKSFAGKGTGIIVQHLPLIERETPFHIEWLSASGEGNRDSDPAISESTLPNWSDASQPAGNVSRYGKLFAELYQKYTGQQPGPHDGETPADVLVSGLKPDEIATLIPADPQSGKAFAVRAAADGTAWMSVPPGDYRLLWSGGAKGTRVEGTAAGNRGYKNVLRVGTR